MKKRPVGTVPNVKENNKDWIRPYGNGNFYFSIF